MNERTEWMDKDHCTVLGIMPLHILSDIWLNGQTIATIFNGQAEGDIYTLTVREKVTILQNIHPLNA